MAKAENDKKISDVAKREEEVLAFWQKEGIFEESEEKKAPKGDFVFNDGPPFATGLPHYGHILPTSIKDAVPRYKTMRGFRVKRKWGWDCHGLPLENIVEKKLGLKTKKDIEEIGIATFNKAARESVLEYADDWKRIIPRLGRWADMDDDYKTMDASYTESVWWVFNTLNDKGLVNEGFKSMHLCPRCGTTLSNFEVAQGYKDIKDLSVMVKLELESEKNTFLLAWTTTPWTLPGNMAAAVHKDEVYVSAELEDGPIVILGKERAENVLKDKPHQKIKEFKGKELVGKSYKPPFEYYQKEEFENKENAWKVWHADYVSQEDGTGLVHIAPAFGADDMELAREHDIPLIHHVGQDGRFVDTVSDFKGMLVKPKDNKEEGIDHMDADIEIIKKLAGDGTLFHKEKIEHSYPHCWRCDTPLLNYATSSWFVTAPSIKKELLKANSEVGWVPQDIRDGRFGKWLEGVRDWAVSRARYWGAPLPVWKDESGRTTFIGSVEELKKYTPTSGNSYHIIRHGESELNTKEILNAELGVENGLTEKGKAQTKEAAKVLKDAKIDLIFHSPLQRTRETAELIREELGLEKNQMTVEGRLKEITFGEFEGKTVHEYHAQYKNGHDRLTITPKGGENWMEVRKRVGEFLYEIENTYKDKNILIVAHNGVHQMLQAAAFGLTEETAGKKIGDDSLDLLNAEVRKIDFTPLPHNENYELDLHRPYIDDVVLERDGEKLTRVPEVFDCWFESGSMPYGQQSYLGKAQENFDPKKDIGFPADFISEGLDQTRGWFYSLIVLGTALFGKSPFKNVVVNGLILAEDGRKMSKSLNNYPDLMGVVNEYGADSVRYYLLSSPAVRGEDFAFSEKGVQEVMRKNIGRLSNVLSFYDLYKDEEKHEASADSGHVLDKWIMARLNVLLHDITKSMDVYELDRATRPIADFIDDLSTWYLRRSRDRFKGDDSRDKKAALSTTKYILIETAKMIAPFMPFYAEHLYRELSENEKSVHLENWNEGKDHGNPDLPRMVHMREKISEGLELRDKANIKVRQPIALVSIPDNSELFPNDVKDEYLKIAKEELNAKKVVFDEGAEVVSIDTNLTPELIQEGEYRDLLRHVQSLRKKEGLEPSAQVTLQVNTDDNGKAVIEAFKDDMQKTAGLREIKYVDGPNGEKVSIGESDYRLEIVQ